MPKKEVGPLQNVQKEGETVKKKVDKFLKDTKKYIRDPKGDTVKGKEYYENYLVLLEEVNTLLVKAQDLREENEPKQVKKFDQKKNDEIKRLENMKESLEATGKNLEPDEVEEGKVRTEGVGTGESEDEDDEEEEEEDEEDEEDSEDGIESETEVKQVSSEKPDKQKSEQDVTKAEESEEEDSGEEESEEYEEESGEEEEIEEEEEEEEVEEEESEEEEEESGEEESEEEEEEEEEFEEMETFAETMRQYVALDSFEGQQEGDLPFNEGEILTIISSSGDGWLKAENDRGERGMVPVTYLQVYNKYTEAQLAEEEVEDDSPRRTSRSRGSDESGKSRWESIRKAVNETSSATDVLQAMGAVPAGFRESTLSKLKAQEQYTAKNNLAPKLSQSCVSYQDIFINPSTQRIRARPVRMQRIVTLIQARQIPLPGTGSPTEGVEVKSRHARMCLFDGHNVLSNIHTIRVATTDKEQHSWTFNSRTTENMKTLDYGEFFVRSNTSENNLGILIELCLSYVRTSTGQDGEFSCGWVHLPLFEQEGQPIQNKQYDVFVHGGTPYEKGVDVDPTIGKKASTSLFRSLLSGNKQPQLALRLNAPTKDQKELLDTLPDTMLSSTCYITYLSYYRQLLADALLQDATNMQSTELRHNPLLAIFPDVVEHPDLMDVLRTSWLERMKKLSRAEKKDPDSLKQVFYKTFMHIVYPLYYAASIPRQVLCNRTVEEERKKEIQRLLQMSKDRNLAFASLLSADVVHKPMDVSEMALNIIGPYSASRVLH